MSAFVAALVGVISLGIIAVFVSNRNQDPRSEVDPIEEGSRVKEIVDEIEIIEEEI